MRYNMDCKKLARTYIYLFRSITFVVFILFFYYGARSTAFAHGDTITVQIDGLAQPPGFFPDFLTLHVNDTVTFINHAYPANSYTISADDGSFSSPPIAPGGQWKVTFISKGAHVYHDATYPQRMVGELLVVDSSVSLLPTPDPLIEATVIAVIKDRKNPPDIITLPVIAHPTAHPATFSILPIILIIVISGAMIVLGAAGFAYYQRYQQHSALSEEDQSESLAAQVLQERIQQTRKVMDDLKKKLQAHSPFRTHKSDDEDENDDWDQL